MIVAFLDFDGVITSPRAFIANDEYDHKEQHGLKWADPIACKLIAKLQKEWGFVIVISSTWRGFGRAHCDEVIAPYGMVLHEDWKTNQWPDGSRPAEIDDWLERNGNPEYIIFDDDSFAWTEEQRARWVHSDVYNGFQCHNFEEATDLLKRLTAKEQKT